MVVVYRKVPLVRYYAAMGTDFKDSNMLVTLNAYPK